MGENPNWCGACRGAGHRLTELGPCSECEGTGYMAGSPYRRLLKILEDHYATLSPEQQAAADQALHALVIQARHRGRRNRH